MRIATYNLRKGGTKRVHWSRMIDDHAVDLLLVQESYPHAEHLPPLLYPDARNRCVWEMAERNGWGSAVFSRSGSLKPMPVPGFRGWVVGAEVEGATWQRAGSPPIAVFSVHAPSKGESYARQVNRLLDEIKGLASGMDIIIGGDFNLTLSHWKGSEKPVSPPDLAIQARLRDEFGLLNCWQAANPDQPLHQTLRWSRDRTTPYHCDGIFVPKSWQDRLLSCVVLAGVEWNDLSDHNPVLAHFRPT